MLQKTKSSLLGAMGGRSGAKGAYRLLNNDKFDAANVLKSIHETTIESIISSKEDTVLLIQDTMDVPLNGHKKTEGLGYCSEHVKGIKLHTCQALTTRGLSLGIAHQSTITREHAKEETLTKSEKMKRPIEEKESFRWLETMAEATKGIPTNIRTITVCDRECDFYEFYNEAVTTDNLFVVRLIDNRVDESGIKIKELLNNTTPAGTFGVEIPRDTRKNIKPRSADLTVTFSEITIKKPTIRKEENILDKITFNAVHVYETSGPAGVEPVEWFLVTNLPVKTIIDARNVLGHYVQRWKIERLHYILKSGCAIEKIQERSVENIVPLLYIYSVIASYILAMTLIGRELPDMPCDVFFDEYEWKILYCAANKTRNKPDKPYTMKQALEYLRTLGVGRMSPSDGDPGVKSIWQGLFALFILEEYAGFVGQV